MTTTKVDLKQAFSDGKLPTGSDFGELIDSMVHVDVFDAHVAEFEAWTKRPKITLGTAPDAWVLAVDDSNHLTIAPAGVAVAPGAADVSLSGYVGSAGRIGANLGRDAFAKGDPGLATATMLAVKGDGGWHTIIAPPGRPCAFEIAALAPAPARTPDGAIRRLLRKLSGWEPRTATVLHAVATAADPGTRPSLRLSQSPSPARAWRGLGWALGLIAAGVGVTKLAEGGGAAGLSAGGQSVIGRVAAALDMPATAQFLDQSARVADGVTGLVLLLLLRQLVIALRLGHVSGRLSWRKVGGGLTGAPLYALSLRSGKGLTPSLDLSVRYHITKLWD